MKNELSFESTKKCDLDEISYQSSKKSKISKIKEVILREKLQFAIFVILSLGILAFTFILSLSNPISFQRFIGEINPILFISLVFLLGIILFTFLLSKSWFHIYRGEFLGGMFRYSIPVFFLAAAVILIDLNFRYPEDINVLFPKSLLFYPIMAYVVEILFHVLPLSLLLILLPKIFKNLNFQKIVWFSIIIISALEPLYQGVLGTPNDFPIGIKIYFGFHLFVFNFLQLYIFKRYGFLSMYSFRVIYYILWHVIWGFLRLEILF